MREEEEEEEGEGRILEMCKGINFDHKICITISVGQVTKQILIYLIGLVTALKI